MGECDRSKEVHRGDRLGAARSFERKSDISSGRRRDGQQGEKLGLISSSCLVTVVWQPTINAAGVLVCIRRLREREQPQWLQQALRLTRRAEEPMRAAEHALRSTTAVKSTTTDSARATRHGH